ncbi:MAG: hypothetical protein IIA67_01730, partial [Planctomycetes bacterium]|nr:hypothetical protein [Planctomycetota bacterium]
MTQNGIVAGEALRVNELRWGGLFCLDVTAGDANNRSVVTFLLGRGTFFGRGTGVSPVMRNHQLSTGETPVPRFTWHVLSIGEPRMSTRERWIVYPLLALALGSSMKSQIIHRFECRTLVASKIEIVDRQSRRQAVLQSTSEGGELSLISPKTAAQTTISPNSIRTRNVVTVGPDGRPQLLSAAADRRFENQTAANTRPRRENERRVQTDAGRTVRVRQTPAGQTAVQSSRRASHEPVRQLPAAQQRLQTGG